MLDYGKVTDTIYKRSVRKVIERNVPGAGDDRIGGRDILYFAADSDKAMLTAFATLRAISWQQQVRCIWQSIVWQQQAPMHWL